jgi:hypothetical protein
MIWHKYISKLSGWLFSLLLVTLGVLNLLMIHPVPGLKYLFLALIFLPPINRVFGKHFGLYIPVALKIILGIMILWFTLEISDLAEIYGL